MCEPVRFFPFLLIFHCILTSSLNRSIQVRDFTHNQGVKMWRKVRDVKFNILTMQKCFLELSR